VLVAHFFISAFLQFEAFSSLRLLDISLSLSLSLFHNQHNQHFQYFQQKRSARTRSFLYRQYRLVRPPHSLIFFSTPSHLCLFSCQLIGVFLSPLSSRSYFLSLSLSLHIDMTRYRKKGPEPWAPTHDANAEYDGAHLNKSLLQESGSHRYRYNKYLTSATSDRSGVRQIVGHFTCYNCHPPRTWDSGQICTQVLYAPTDRYRTILHAQKCQACEAYAEPEVDLDNYAKKIVSALDLWTGRRRRMESHGHYKRTGPHDTERCHGCQIGICSDRL